MTSMRENPIRRQPPGRPQWLVPVLVVVGVLVVVALGYAVVAMVRGINPPDAGEGADSPSPCVTRTVTPGQSLPRPAKVRVNVYNASGVAGLAGRTADQLEARGFKIGNVDNDPTGRDVTGIAEIRFGPKGERKAQLVLAYVPGATLVALDRPGTKVDLAMGKDFDGLAAQDRVDAALAEPTVVATGPGCPSGAAGSSGAP